MQNYEMISIGFCLIGIILLALIVAVGMIFSHINKLDSKISFKYKENRKTIDNRVDVSGVDFYKEQSFDFEFKGFPSFSKNMIIPENSRWSDKHRDAVQYLLRKDGEKIFKTLLDASEFLSAPQVSERSSVTETSVYVVLKQFELQGLLDIKRLKPRLYRLKHER